MKPTAETFSELQKAYDHFNEALFDGALPGCLLSLQRINGTMGLFSPKRFTNARKVVIDEIAVNPEYFAVIPLMEVMQTFVHEMVHQWQLHFGEPGRGRYHNKEWAEKMKSIGLMPSNTGKPDGRQTGDRMSDYPLENGLFLTACKTLLTKKFKIIWYDRYPPALTTLLSGGESIETDSEMDLTIPANSDTLDMPVEGTKIKKALRAKYNCLNCAINMWGKPKLNVICGVCGKKFDELRK